MSDQSLGITAHGIEEDLLASILDRSMSRRRGLGVLTAGATALLGGLSSACGILQLASECEPISGPDCCHLASCQECDWEGSKDQYTCPEHYQRSFWTCIDSLGNSVVCAECTPSDSCFRGPFACSIWY